MQEAVKFPNAPLELKETMSRVVLRRLDPGVWVERSGQPRDVRRAFSANGSALDGTGQSPRKHCQNLSNRKLPLEIS